MIRVELPHHLRTLARVGHEVTVDVEGEPTLGAVIDAIEARYPMLRGRFAIITPGSVVPSCGSTPARKTGRTSRRTPRCRARSQPERNRCSSSARCREG